MYRPQPSSDPQIRRVPLIGRITGCTNPESAELLPDGETVVFGNCQMIRDHPHYRQGRGNVYIRGGAFISRAKVTDRDRFELDERRLIEGLTATLGCDVLRKPTMKFPAGTVFIDEGANPVADGKDGPIVDREEIHPRVLAFDPNGGTILGEIPLGPQSDLARRFNGLDQPNGFAISAAGDLFIGDIPNGNPVETFPTPSIPAIYRVPYDAIDRVAAGGAGSADAVEQIETPGFVNGLACGKDDDASWAVSCSGHDPVKGGVYRLTLEDWRTGRQPAPVISGLGILDGVGVTRRGTILVSTPVTGEVHAFLPDGTHLVLRDPQGDKLARFPADINVCYPNVLEGEPALLVPDVSMLSPPGDGMVTMIDISGL
jgi:hypothetical protein